jgi:hypothetical protein
MNPEIDNVWGSQYYSGPNGSSTYFDYYFSGQDIMVTIDGCQTDPNYASLPIQSLAYSVRQETMPIYGYNSYVYDALVKGRRSIFGTFHLLTRSPDYMIQALALAAYNRYQNLNSVPTGYAAPLSEDDQNLLTYWGNNMDASLQPGQYNLFSDHPPFTFMIQYGVQDISANQNIANQLNAAFAQSATLTNGGVTNINDRLVGPDPTLQQYMVILLDGCQLINMETGYDTTGRPISEAYNFIAHDVIYPPPSQATQSII